MNRMLAAGTAWLRSAVALVLGGGVVLLMPSLLAAPVDTPSSVVLAAVAVAVAAVAVSSRRFGTFVAQLRTSRPREADEVSVLLPGRVTDPVHHPLRPRAPGLV